MAESRTYTWVLAGFPLWGPLRTVLRMVCAVLWVAFCYVTLGIASLSWFVSRPAARRVQKRVARMWVLGMRAIIGIRLTEIGQPPPAPYFIVFNHLSWADFIAVETLLDASCVLQAEDETFPFVGTLMTCLNPFFIKRQKKEDTERVIPLMTEAIRNGRSVMMAPEGVVGPGREVRHFHAALFESAIATKMPVHYFSITYRTPEGCPPPSKVALFGPDPCFRTPEGKIPDSELEAWGPERSFVLHLFRLLALPWHEIVFRYAPDPVTGTERRQLAKDCQAAVQAIFTPVP
jgi:1-acyl-sn-glycerol-3-phosphate acyltransferase